MNDKLTARTTNRTPRQGQGQEGTPANLSGKTGLQSPAKKESSDADSKPKSGKRTGRSEAQRGTFKKWQNEAMRQRQAAIAKALATAGKSKAKYGKMTHFAQEIADMVAKEQGIPCALSTLLRNQAYRELIAAAYEKAGGDESPRKSPKMASIAAGLENSNLAAENARLRSYILSLEKQLDREPSARNPTGRSEPKALENPNTAKKIENLQKAVFLLVKNFQGILSIDEDGNIVDLSKKINAIVVPSKLLGPSGGSEC